MAQAGFTPISLYFSSTAAAVPTSGNLANGELALNIADMKLYAKNSAGTVTLLASNAGASGSVTSVSGTGTVNGLTLTGTVTTSGSLTLGGTLSLVSPPPIGSTTPNTGAFTTLSATGQITGRPSNGAVFVTSNGSDADFVLSLASGIVTQNVTGSLLLQTGGVNRAVISSTGLAVTGTASVTQSTGAGILTLGTSSGRTQYQYVGFAGQSGGIDYGWQIGRSPTAGVVPDGFYIYDILSNATRFAIDLAGNVGMGTTTPANQLTVYRTSSTTSNGALRLDGNGNYAGVQFASSGTLEGSLCVDNATMYMTHGNAITFRTGSTANVGGTDRFRIGSLGQFGIGATPDYGTAGQVLTSGGSGAAPTWAAAGGGGSVFSAFSSTGESVFASQGF